MYEDIQVMCDGVLWDPRAPAQPIHKFDRFANYGGGSFHPARPEVLVSSAVWNVRKSCICMCMYMHIDVYAYIQGDHLVGRVGRAQELQAAALVSFARSDAHAIYLYIACVCI